MGFGRARTRRDRLLEFLALEDPPAFRVRRLWTLARERQGDGITPRRLSPQRLPVDPIQNADHDDDRSLRHPTLVLFADELRQVLPGRSRLVASSQSEE